MLLLVRLVRGGDEGAGERGGRGGRRVRLGERDERVVGRGALVREERDGEARDLLDPAAAAEVEQVRAQRTAARRERRQVRGPHARLAAEVRWQRHCEQGKKKKWCVWVSLGVWREMGGQGHKANR